MLKYTIEGINPCKILENPYPFMDLQQQLYEWASKYNLDGSKIRFIDHSVHGEAMGTTKALSGGGAEIRLHHKLEGHGCAS